MTSSPVVVAVATESLGLWRCERRRPSESDRDFSLPPLRLEVCES
jgi:hypothetical protein